MFGRIDCGQVQVNEHEELQKCHGHDGYVIYVERFGFHKKRNEIYIDEHIKDDVKEKHVAIHWLNGQEVTQCLNVLLHAVPDQVHRMDIPPFA